jgi:hypothetical protein
MYRYKLLASLLSERPLHWRASPARPSEHSLFPSQRGSKGGEGESGCDSFAVPLPLCLSVVSLTRSSSQPGCHYRALAHLVVLAGHLGFLFRVVSLLLLVPITFLLGVFTSTAPHPGGALSTKSFLGLHNKQINVER